MKNLKRIILGPIITEKSNYEKELKSTYVFEVAPKANKTEIKQAVQKLFDVDVISVRTSNLIGKVKRTRWIPGRRPNRKKAYVKIKEDQRIDIFEGV